LEYRRGGNKVKSINKVAFIIPCYNECKVINEFYRRVKNVVQELSAYEFEFLFINDGSTDGTAELLNLLAEHDISVRVLHFAKNFGHQIAITAGMDYASGDVFVTIDADLQDPPELVKDMLLKIQDGYQVVHAQRKSRAGETKFKLITAWMFYQLMHKFLAKDLVENCGDFRAFTCSVAKAAQSFREQHRFMRGMFAIIGFRQCVIQYDRDARYAGKTKYSLQSMIRLANNAVFSFSSAPIKAINWLSFVLCGISLIYLIKSLINHFIFHETVQGWTSVITLLFFFSGLNIFILGVIGSYVGRIFEQGKQRPLYWLSDIKNIDISKIDECNLLINEVAISNNIISTALKGV
jgi:dolichol-phosphate mannosyltransferase